MQQVEQGKLDLDRDINEYLDFKIPATYPQPITLRNIMTHTSGFEETIQELFVADGKSLKPIGDYLKQHLRRASSLRERHPRTRTMQPAWRDTLCSA